ncbi:prepilin-type N-terminal cleavage/methylation domain-containing protein [Zoogloea sp.]|jgi:type IV pilus assembly protein PilV|uniref:type IV pilus modification PilV family protein n=1 Tax=Zoogloea sp. TaxID=49181 RepID=UPI0035B2F768
MKKNRGQAGYVLLEVLVALLIFSLGLLGLIGFQAASAKIAADSRFRTEAAMLADELIAKMAATDITKVKSGYAVGGSELKTWVANRVVGGSRLPSPVVTPTFSTSSTSQTMLVNVRIEWTLPGTTLDKGGREVKGIYETRALLF